MHLPKYPEVDNVYVKARTYLTNLPTANNNSLPIPAVD